MSAIERLELALEPRLSSTGRLLEALQALPCRQSCVAQQAPGLALAAAEALTNIVRHGLPLRAISASVEVSDDRVVVELRDSGREFDMCGGAAELPPDPLAEHGRGLYLIRESVDACGYRRAGAENVHRLEKLI